MANGGSLGTLVQMVMDDLHVPGIADTVRRKAIQAMRFCRDKRYWFSDKELTFTLTAGRQTYRPGDGFGLPKDLVEIATKTIWILIDGSNDQRTACNRVDSLTWEDSRASWGNSSSQPEEWDFRTGALRFSPPSQNSTDVAELRYLSDIGIPKVTYESGAYKYFHPVTMAEMSSTDLDNFTNDWLQQDSAEAMIRARTMYMLQKEFLRDPEGANDSLGVWLEMTAQLENETESKVAGLSELPGCILD